MNVVRITSGLGNQIFQYAFYCALKTNIPGTKMDISEFGYRNHHNGYELEKVFTILPDYADKKACQSLADVSKDWFSDFRRKYLKIKLKCSGTLIEEDELGTGFHPEILSLDQSYFHGFWQNEKYFLPIADILHKELTFKQPLDDQNKRISESIAAGNSVSIHLRRGDYMKKRRMEAVGSVCSLDYYKRAIEYMESKVENPRFFIFSDDIQWVRENLSIQNATYIDINSGKNSYKDMQLMSLCNHNIIANSSFSWWGAWLNNHADKIIVAPSIWFRDVDLQEIVPPNWVKIPVD